jgi:hypothetical protein
MSINTQNMTNLRSTVVANSLPNQDDHDGKFLMTNGSEVEWATVDTLPNQSNNSGKFLTTNGQTVEWATVDTLPDQSNNSDKFLTTNGQTVEWATVDTLPNQSNNSGEFLMTNGQTVEWATVDTLPNQGSANSGKFLKTNGQTVEWAKVDGLPDQGSANSGKFLKTNGSEASWAKVDGLPDQGSANSGKFLTTDGSEASWAAVSGLVCAKGTISSDQTFTASMNALHLDELISNFPSNAQLQTTDSVTSFVTPDDGVYLINCILRVQDADDKIYDIRVELKETVDGTVTLRQVWHWNTSNPSGDDNIRMYSVQFTTHLVLTKNSLLTPFIRCSTADGGSWTLLSGEANTSFTVQGLSKN